MRWLNRGLHMIECRPVELLESYPAIFIIGAPRSGTTLLYQILINQFEVGYVSNRLANWYGGLSYAQRIIRGRKLREGVSYRSKHGRTPGSAGPHECGEYWYQFFCRQPHHVALAEFSEESVRRLRCSFSRICNSFNSPVVFKNVMNSGRLSVLKEALPGALFIDVQRGLLDNAHSLLKGRLDACGNTRTWWSLQPHGYEALLDRSPERQVVETVCLTNSMINSDLPPGSKNRHSCTYEKICSDPTSIVAQIESFANRESIPLRRRSGAEAPASFQPGGGCRIDPDIYSRLAELIVAKNLSRERL